jgi:hypothetical protein
MSAFKFMVFDRKGFLWVKHYTVDDYFQLHDSKSSIAVPPTPTEWSVFDPKGRWQGTVELPARFVPVDIGSKDILGFGRGDGGIEEVWLVDLDRRETTR